MKLLADEKNVEVYGSEGSRSFTIEAGAKAFLILSDTLYSNKIRAVVRELSTNAYDSHVDAGCANKPFDVYLPSSLEPYFKIRDYGTGMSHEDCMTLYTTYFKSTRNTSNEAVGCLGLGSKSPFAYADSFTVEAFYDGVKRVYTGYKNTYGPQFDLMSEEYTDEPNGICVIVPVQRYDNSTFLTEAENIYKTFDTKPNFVGFDVSFEDYEPIISGKNWSFHKNEENHAVMGQISYPIDSENFSKFPEVKEFLNSVSGFRVDVKIGDLDITPSRESLSYNEQTIVNLAEAISNIDEDIVKKIGEDLNDCKTIFEARMKYFKLDSLIKSLSSDIEWNGQKLFDDRRDYSINVKLARGTLSKYSKRYYGRKNFSIENFVQRMVFSPESIYYVYNDMEKGFNGRLNKYLQQCMYNRNSNVYVFSGAPIEDFLELLGGAKVEDVVLVSSMEKPSVNRSSRNSGGSIPCWVFNTDTEVFEPSKMSVKYSNAIYLEETRGNVKINGKSVSIHTAGTIIQSLINIGFDPCGTFYTVKPSVIENQWLKDRKNWRNGDNLLKEAFEDSFEEYKQDYSMLQNKCFFNNSSTIQRIFSDMDQGISDLLKEYAKYLEIIQTAESRIKSFTFLIQYFGNYIGSSHYTGKYRNDYFNEAYKLIASKYKLLSKLFYDVESAKTYVKDMNELFKLRENSAVSLDNA